MNRKQQTNLQVIGNERLASGFFLLTLQSEEALPVILPAQFAEIQIPNKATFLRRPISIHDVDYDNNRIYFLVKIAGNGTAELSNIAVGDTLNVVFPLGNTFDLSEINGKVLLVGGGVGVAPLLYTAKYLNKFGIEADILLGYRTKSNILRRAEYEDQGRVFYTTNDGSYGEVGTILDHTIFTSNDFWYSKILACGPEPMMRGLAKWANENRIECEVSLENKMACGIGACLCCVQDTKQGHKCVCTEGPVFNVKQLLW